MIREAIVLAGGLGTRLQPIVRDIPKSMAIINGRPFLEYLLDHLDSCGIEHVVLSTGYKSEYIRDHFQDQYRSISLKYVMEEIPLGTGGGIRRAFDQIKGEDAFVLNGDSLFLTDLESMYRFHKSSDTLITIALSFRDNIERYGSVEMDHLHRIINFREKGAHSGAGYINGGVYILNKHLLKSELFPDRFSIEKDCFEEYFRTVEMLGFPSEAYFLDIGIPSDYEKAKDEFKRFEYR